MTTRNERRTNWVVIAIVATLCCFGTAGGSVSAADGVTSRPASSSRHMRPILSVASTSDPSSDTAPVESTAPSDTTPESTTPGDTTTATGSAASNGSSDPLTATLALAGFAILLAIAGWWMVRHQSPDEQPYPRPVDDVGEFPDGLL